MFYLFGINKNLEAISIVSRNFLKTDPFTASFPDLKKAYMKFSCHIQPAIPNNDNQADVCFVEDDLILDKLSEIFHDPISSAEKKVISGFPFEKIIDKKIIKNKYNLVKDTINKYQQIIPEFCFLFNLLFSHIFLIKTDHIACATIPKAMGLLLLDHRLWTMADIFEMLVHETAHQLITLDEYCHVHYFDMEKLNNIDNFAISAMRATKRPLNKVIHSLIVAYEILAHRKTMMESREILKVHPETPVLIKQIRVTLDSIKKLNNLDNILAPRAKNIVNAIDRNLYKYQ